MSDDRELSPEEIRVLGCLVEKEATTPDNYPLSTNALLLACNQSTSREPIVHYTERVIDATMLNLRERRLARTVRGEGQRVNKHRHVLGEAWSLDRAALAVLSVLMLRGPQTAAELRARADRYGVDLDGDVTESVLRALGDGDAPFVAQLPRRPGERESRWIHLLGDPAAIEAARTSAPSSVDIDAGMARGPSTGDRIAALEAQMAEVLERLAALNDRLDALAAALGE